MTDTDLFLKFQTYFTERGWTFDDAAEAIGVSRSTLFNWKNGRPIGKRGRAAIRALVAAPDEQSASTSDSRILRNLIFAVVDLDIDDASKTKVIRLIKSMLDSPRSSR